MSPTVGPVGRIVAKNIARLREARGLSQGGLVSAMSEIGRSMPQSGLSEVELGVRRVDPDELHLLAAALGVTVGELFTAPACDKCHDAPKPWTKCMACGAEAQQ
jgi:transcriptional regulator with XRE-family HTH domain